MRHPWIYCVLLIFLFGCQDANSDLITVTGQVTWNQQPLPEGNISFEPQDASKPASGGPIVQGKYSCRVSPGKNLVRIVATRSTGAVDPAMGAAPREQYLPVQYNAESQLSAEVSTQQQQFNFDLTEQPK